MSKSALMQAYELTQCASREGFDWDSPFMAAEKVREELEEVIAELQKPEGRKRKEALQDEIGDLFMACSCLARHCEIIPDEAILKGTQKFSSRYAKFKKYLEIKGISMSEISSNKKRALWRESRDQYSAGLELHKNVSRETFKR